MAREEHDAAEALDPHPRWVPTHDKAAIVARVLSEGGEHD